MDTVSARFNKSGNVKLGNMWSWSTLMGSTDWFVPKLGIAVTGTCGQHCASCEDDCYVRKSYLFRPSVLYGHARNTLALRSNPEGTFDTLEGYIRRAQNPPDFIRINQSGEVEKIEELKGWEWLAEMHPDTILYLYTKAYEYAVPELLAGNVPMNLIILISIWHEMGIEAFNKVKHLPNVKAFVYDDGEFDYAAHGLEIQTYCGAYDDKGHLNHNITCQKCKLCFNCNARAKVIGCKAH